MQVKRLVAYGAMALALASSGVAYASEATVEGPTGPDSANVSEVNENNELNVSVKNKAYFDAKIKDIKIHTGNNKVKNNTTAGDNTSGEAHVDIQGSVDINQSSNGACGCAEGFFNNGGNTASVSGPTGPKSDNFATVNQNNVANIDVYNKAKVNLEVKNVNIDTGNNESSWNTTVGDTKSGDASFQLLWNTSITQN